MKANTYNYNVYKNEFCNTMVEYFKNTFEVVHETEKVIEFTNLSEQDCKNIAACMFKNVNECKAIFSNVKRIDEEMVEFISKIEKAHAMLKDALIALHKTPAYLGGELMSDKELEMYDKAHLANSTFNKAFLEYRR